MRDLARKIELFLKEILDLAENQQEILAGPCKSESELGQMREHLLMLLIEKPRTNTELATHLQVSKAAVTKSIRVLEKKELVQSVKSTNDARVTFYQLTPKAYEIAQEHLAHHKHTVQVLEKVAQHFSVEHQAVIEEFLELLLKQLQEETEHRHV